MLFPPHLQPIKLSRPTTFAHVKDKCTAVLLNDSYRRLGPDPYGNPLFASLVMEVPPPIQPYNSWVSPESPPPSPTPSDTTVDYEPLPWPPSGWEAKGGGWFGPE